MSENESESLDESQKKLTSSKNLESQEKSIEESIEKSIKNLDHNNKQIQVIYSDSSENKTSSIENKSNKQTKQFKPSKLDSNLNNPSFNNNLDSKPNNISPSNPSNKKNFYNFFNPLYKSVYPSLKSLLLILTLTTILPNHFLPASLSIIFLQIFFKNEEFYFLTSSLTFIAEITKGLNNDNINDHNNMNNLNINNMNDPLTNSGSTNPINNLINNFISMIPLYLTLTLLKSLILLFYTVLRPCRLTFLPREVVIACVFVTGITVILMPIYEHLDLNKNNLNIIQNINNIQNNFNDNINLDSNLSFLILNYILAISLFTVTQLIKGKKLIKVVCMYLSVVFLMVVGNFIMFKCSNSNQNFNSISGSKNYTAKDLMTSISSKIPSILLSFPNAIFSILFFSLLDLLTRRENVLRVNLVTILFPYLFGGKVGVSKDQESKVEENIENIENEESENDKDILKGVENARDEDLKLNTVENDDSKANEKDLKSIPVVNINNMDLNVNNIDSDLNTVENKDLKANSMGLKVSSIENVENMDLKANNLDSNVNTVENIDSNANDMDPKANSIENMNLKVNRVENIDYKPFNVDLNSNNNINIKNINSPPKTHRTNLTNTIFSFTHLTTPILTLLSLLPHALFPITLSFLPIILGLRMVIKSSKMMIEEVGGYYGVEGEIEDDEKDKIEDIKNDEKNNEENIKNIENDGRNTENLDSLDYSREENKYSLEEDLREDSLSSSDIESSPQESLIEISLENKPVQYSSDSIKSNNSNTFNNINSTYNTTFHTCKPKITPTKLKCSFYLSECFIIFILILTIFLTNQFVIVAVGGWAILTVMECFYEYYYQNLTEYDKNIRKYDSNYNNSCKSDNSISKIFKSYFINNFSSRSTLKIIKLKNQKFLIFIKHLQEIEIEIEKVKDAMEYNNPQFYSKHFNNEDFRDSNTEDFNTEDSDISNNPQDYNLRASTIYIPTDLDNLLTSSSTDTSDILPKKRVFKLFYGKSYFNSVQRGRIERLKRGLGRYGEVVH